MDEVHVSPDAKRSLLEVAAFRMSGVFSGRGVLAFFPIVSGGRGTFTVRGVLGVLPAAVPRGVEECCWLELELSTSWLLAQLPHF